MEFRYTDNVQDYEYLMNQLLVQCRCKHVMNLSGEKARRLFEVSTAYGYPQVMWGYGSGIYQDEVVNRVIQVEVIRKMIYKQRTHPFRVVIDVAGIPWIDNLHSVIRDILVFDEGVSFSKVWFYIVDFSQTPVVVADYQHSLSVNLDDVFGAIKAAEKRVCRTNPDIRRVGYTIGEFMTDNQISREALGLEGHFYDDYVAAFCKHITTSLL